MEVIYMMTGQGEQMQEKDCTSTVQQGKDANESSYRMNIQKLDTTEAKLKDFLHEKPACGAVQESCTCADLESNSCHHSITFQVVSLLTGFCIPSSQITLGFPGDTVITNLQADEGDTRKSLLPRLGRSPGMEMAMHSNILAQRIPWTEGPCGLQSTGSQRV